MMTTMTAVAAVTMSTPQVTDSELLAAPGGPYAVLRRIREDVRGPSARVITAQDAVRAATPQDPWARPDWDTDTTFLQLVRTTW